MANNETVTNGLQYLPFEDKIAQLDRQIEELKRIAAKDGIDTSAEIRRLQREETNELKRLYANLTPWQIVQVSRHPQRPCCGIISTTCSRMSGSSTATAASGMTVRSSPRWARSAANVSL